ncbi:hypothetical protein AB1Y20_015479 [Prymnesium parvum]|uniref:Uncharacterized protein n=1 Tax=Prymnesium parvum TaxID=97485 RepID=A0AB34K0K1_PRYPA
MSLRIEDLTMHHARRTEIIPGSRRPNMPQHHLYDHEVGPSTGSALQVVMDDVARTQEQQRLAHRVAQMASDLELCREEQAHTANLAAQREYVLQRQVEQAVQAAKEAEEAHRGTLREAQAAWMRVRELEQLVAFAEADRDEARADKESVIQEITSLREELHTCHLQAQELRSSEASAIRTHQKAADDARSSLARVERERDEAVRALGAEAKAHKLREQKLEAQCEQLRKETERMSTMVDAAEVQRERDRGALALERVMQAAASQEEAWGKELKAA